MSFVAAEVARPTLVLRELLGWPSRSSRQDGAPLRSIENFVGIDVAKLKNAIAEVGRNGEIRYAGGIACIPTTKRGPPVTASSGSPNSLAMTTSSCSVADPENAWRPGAQRAER